MIQREQQAVAGGQSLNPTQVPGQQVPQPSVGNGGASGSDVNATYADANKQIGKQGPSSWLKFM